MSAPWSKRPWSTDPEFGHECVLDAKGVIVADCAIMHRTRITGDESRANARLMAAAPDLYDALVGLWALVLAEGYRPAPHERPLIKDGIRDQKIAAARAALDRAADA